MTTHPDTRGNLPPDAEDSARAALSSGGECRCLQVQPTVPLLSRRDTRPLTPGELGELRGLVLDSGYGGVLLRWSDTWPGARSAAYATERTRWFRESLADVATAVPRRVEPSKGRYGVYIVPRRALEDTTRSMFISQLKGKLR